MQDSWTLKRLTINPGHPLRILQLGDPGRERSTAGRFAAARCVPAGSADVPNWKNLAPRFSVVYDLTGDAKTALKGSINSNTTAPTPPTSPTATIRWCCRATRATGPTATTCPATSTCSPLRAGDQSATASRRTTRSGRATTGTSASSPTRRRRSERSKRPLRHRVQPRHHPRRWLSGVSVTGAWYRRETYNLEQQLNTLVSAVATSPAFDDAKPAQRRAGDASTT